MRAAGCGVQAVARYRAAFEASHAALNACCSGVSARPVCSCGTTCIDESATSVIVLSTVAPPLVGAMGLRTGSFVLLDGLGSMLWAGLAVGLGYVFSAQIDVLLAALASAGTVAFELVLVLLALYIAALGATPQQAEGDSANHRRSPDQHDP